MATGRSLVGTLVNAAAAVKKAAGRGRKMPAVAGAVIALAAAGNACAAGARLLGSYDFTAGRGVNLEVEVTPEGYFTVGDYDGHRLLRVMPGVTTPVVIREGLEEPGLPPIDPEDPGQRPPADIRVNLTLIDRELPGIDPRTPGHVMVVLDLYDVGLVGAMNTTYFVIHGNGPGRGDAVARGATTGSHWGRMPMTRVRLRERPYLLRNTLLDGNARGARGADVSIEVTQYLFLRAVSLYRVKEAEYDRFEELLRAFNEDHVQLLRRRALVEDLGWQARMKVFYLGAGDGRRRGPAARLSREAAALGRLGRETLALVEDIETAGDNFYFEGRVAVARGDMAGLEAAARAIGEKIAAAGRLLDEADRVAERVAARAMTAVRADERYWWFAPLRTSPPPMPFHGGKINPRERIIFSAGGHSAPARFQPFAHALGVNHQKIWHLYGWLDEDRENFPASVENREPQFSELYMNEIGTSIWSHFHNHRLRVSSWFFDKYEGETDIWAWTSDGEVSGSRSGATSGLNIFNDEVRRLFVDHHREIARRNRYTRYWNLPVLGAEVHQATRVDGRWRINAFSPSAREKFRAYLEGIYGDIGAMNAELGTGYPDFAAVEPPAGLFSDPHRHPGPLDYHFVRFWRSGPVELFAMIAEAMKAENPEFLSWFEGSGLLDRTPRHGMDTYNLMRVSDIGCGHAQGEFTPIWNMSLQRYFPGSVYGKDEAQVYSNKRQCDPDVEMLRAGMHAGQALEMICGNRALTVWRAPTGYARALEGYGPNMHDRRFDAVPYRNTAEWAVFRKRADMFLPLLNNLRWRHPKVGVLYSTTTNIIGRPFQEIEFEIANLHQWLFYSSTPYFVVHEDAVADTRETLGEYRVIFVPYGPLTRHETSRKWLDWVRVGGVLLSSGPFGVHDQFGREDLTVLRAVFGEGLKVARAEDEIAAGGGNRLDEASIAYLRAEGIHDIETVSGWFWDIEAGELPETASVLLRLEDGRPVLLAGEYGAGRVMFSACGSFANQLGTIYLNQLRRRVAPFARPSKQYGLLAFPLEDATRRTYLKVINHDLYRTVRDTVTVDAALRRVVDVGLDQGFPVPFRTEGNRTEIDLELEPGASAFLDLGLQADMTWDVVQANEDSGYPPAPVPDVYTAKMRAIAASGLSPEARRESFALMALARRWASRGVANKAAGYAARAAGVRGDPDFVSFDGERVRARRVAEPMAIDGRLDDWAGHETYELKGSAVSGGVFRAAYDDDYLYLAVVVRSDNVKELGDADSAVNWYYAGHGVRVSLNASDTAGRVPSDLLDVHLHDGVANLFFEVGGRMRAMPYTVPAPGRARSATRRIENGYVMEIAVPLEDYYILPAEGASIGFDLLLRGATGTFSRYARREGRWKDGRRLARLYFD